MVATLPVIGNGLLAAPANPVEAPDHVHGHVGIVESHLLSDPAKAPAVRAVHDLQHTRAAA